MTLESIVEAAVRIADRDGLEAVSIRRVAADLGGRPMSLYSFVANKESLVARMLDAVMAEAVLTELPGDWRAALLAIARRTIEVGARHPWIIAAGLQTRSPGPNTLAHALQTLDALSGLGVDRDRAQSLATAIDVYTIGFATVSGIGLGASADDPVFVDGITWILDGFEREIRRLGTSSD